MSLKIKSKPKTAYKHAVAQGDFVAWDNSGGKAHGKVVEVKTDGELTGLKGNTTVKGTEDSPVAKVRVYRDGEPTEDYVGHNLDSLNKAEAPKGAKRAHRLPRRKRALDPSRFRGLNSGDRVATPDNENGVIVSAGEGNRELFDGQPYVVVRIDEGSSEREETYQVTQVRKAQKARKARSKNADLGDMPSINDTIEIKRTGEIAVVLDVGLNGAALCHTRQGGDLWIHPTKYVILDHDLGNEYLSAVARRGILRRAAPEPTDPAKGDYDALYQRTVERYEADPQIDTEAVVQAVEKAWEMSETGGPSADEDADKHVDVFLGKQTRREAKAMLRGAKPLRCPACNSKTARSRRNPNMFVCKRDSSHVSELELA